MRIEGQGSVGAVDGRNVREVQCGGARGVGHAVRKLDQRLVESAARAFANVSGSDVLLCPAMAAPQVLRGATFARFLQPVQ